MRFIALHERCNWRQRGQRFARGSIFFPPHVPSHNHIVFSCVQCSIDIINGPPEQSLRYAFGADRLQKKTLIKIK